MLIALIVIGIFFIPADAEAWGPLTHIYLGYQVLDIGASLVPVGIYAFLKKYRNDFLYGNLCPDIILGRRFQGIEKNSHHWEIAWKMLASSCTNRQKAFAYGYLTHLCADTVVHNMEHNGMRFGHSMLELKSESLIDKKYRRIMKRLDKGMQRKNDVFLEKRLESLFFSFKTNRRIFKGFLVLSRLPNCMPVSNFIDNRFPYEIPVLNIYKFQNESLTKMVELLNNGKDSDVLKKTPLGRYHRKAS